MYLTNSTTSAVSGVMSSVNPAPVSAGKVPTYFRTVSVPALGTTAVNPATGIHHGAIASSIIFAGGGVVANQVVSGADGWSTAPCASQTSSQWAFAGGSTTAGNTLTLTLFNPSSTEAVVNISFLTGSGRVTPQAYQGLVVPAGQVVVENVGDYVQDASAIATFVTAQAGSLVANQFQQWGSGSGGGVSLQLGAPALSTVWRFAQTTIEEKSAVNFTLANPGEAAVSATITLGLSSGSVVPRQVVVPPASTLVFAASSSAGLPKQVPFSLTVNTDAPIVVGRSVQAPPGAPHPAWGSSAGTVTTASHWVVPGPGVLHAPGTAGATVDSLALANPGPTAARVTVTMLGSGRMVAGVTVGPEGVMVLGPKMVGGLSALTVASDQPVYVEEDSGPAGAPGIVSSTGFPFPS